MPRRVLKSDLFAVKLFLEIFRPVFEMSFLYESQEVEATAVELLALYLKTILLLLLLLLLLLDLI